MKDAIKKEFVNRGETTTKVIPRTMMDRWFVFLFLAGIAAATATEGNQKNESIHFFAIGDWGLEYANENYTNTHQRLVARGMARVASRRSPQFVVSLGDNFYFEGVPSNTTQAHRRFRQTFEDVYDDPALAAVPWYAIAGNHDYAGSVESQMNYTGGGRWKFPSLYHAHSFSSSRRRMQQDETTSSSLEDDGVTVDVVLIDTVKLGSLNDEYNPLPLLSKDYDREQWSWIEDRLRQSRADYLLVAGHYPVYSVCFHGPTPTLVQHLQPLLEKHGAHHLSGHDHGMMHWRVENSTVNYILNGAGSRCCCDIYNRTWDNDLNPPVATSLKWYLDDTRNNHRRRKAYGGFLSFQATKESMKVQYRDETGRVLFQPDPILPRSRAQKEYSTKKEETLVSSMG